MSRTIRGARQLSSGRPHRRLSPKILKYRPSLRRKRTRIHPRRLYTLASPAAEFRVRHHFESAEQQKDASTIGMWLFLVTEIMFFGGMFMAYFVYRQWYPDAFASASGKTNLLIGAFNTTVLICSSLTMAMAVHYAALGKKNLIIIFLILTLILGG